MRERACRPRQQADMIRQPQWKGTRAKRLKASSSRRRKRTGGFVRRPAKAMGAADDQTGCRALFVALRSIWRRATRRGLRYWPGRCGRQYRGGYGLVRRGGCRDVLDQHRARRRLRLQLWADPNIQRCSRRNGCRWPGDRNDRRRIARRSSSGGAVHRSGILMGTRCLARGVRRAVSGALIAAQQHAVDLVGRRRPSPGDQFGRQRFSPGDQRLRFVSIGAVPVLQGARMCLGRSSTGGIDAIIGALAPQLAFGPGLTDRMPNRFAQKWVPLDREPHDRDLTITARGHLRSLRRSQRVSN